MTKQSEKSQKFESLQRKYSQQLPEKMRRLHSQWATFLQGDSDGDTAFAEVKSIIHGLAGSAGTFLYDLLGEEASRGEKLLCGLRFPLTENQNVEVGQLLERLSELAFNGPRAFAEEPMRATRLHGERIRNLVYVVEDDASLAAEIVRQLRYFGYRARSFEDRTSGLEAANSECPSAMVIDVQLPEGRLAGTEFAQQVQSQLPQVPLIFISVRDDWEARLAAVRGGGQSYLVKPIDFAQLLDRLDALTHSSEVEPFRILLVDDHEELADHYALVLRNAGMRAQVVSETNFLLESLEYFLPELILMDLNMPHCSGTEAANVVRQKDEYTGIPIVYLSTESDPERLLEAMRVGGDDCLRKPISDQDLVAAVSIRAERFRRIRALMNRDSLTGLLNHATIKTYLSSEVSRANRERTPLSMALIDIDHFKGVNDRYGHLMGDRVLKNLARLFVQRLRRSDLVGRYGGEEFALIFPSTQLAEAQKIVEELRHHFSGVLNAHHAERFSCTFSAGIASAPPWSSADELIAAADRALYLAKAQGRNRVVIDG